jgi:DNA helicase-4
MRVSVAGGAPLDLVLPVLAILVLVAATVAFLLLRKRQLFRVEVSLSRDEASLREIDRVLQPFTSAASYIPERVRRPADAELKRIVGDSLPSATKVLRRARDGDARQRAKDALGRAQAAAQMVRDHNDKYVQRVTQEHAKLLLDELRLDEAQRVATVRDDERNLVVAGAGSGKTRTLIARIRFLLECGVPPTAILAVTFTNKATEEMEGRLKEMNTPVADRDHDGVTVSTLHALGKRVVQATLSGPISVADDLWTDSLVAAALKEARTARDSRLAQRYLDSLLYFYRNEDERAPATGGDVTYRTLRGEHVRSLGERVIADFLLTHHVPYEYEARAAWAQVGRGRRAYHPDFTLLESGACIEYWGINRAGKVPSGWAGSSAEYREGMEWKRAEFQRTGKTLLEFFDYERTEGTLEHVIPERLTGAGVTLRPMALEELEGTLRDMKYVGSAIERLLVQFISNARSLRLTPDLVRKHLARASPRVHHFGLLGIAVLERYETAVADEGRIDFSDMLHRAADSLEAGANPLPKFQHILVDEFQDMSAAMARFVKALVAVNRARLFAVGDDWQAIYGFAGGDVDHIVNFEKHFGVASTTMLNVNYRSPSLIVEAGTALIAYNPNQVPKHVVVSSSQRGEAYVHEVPDDDAELVGATIRLLQEERRNVPPEDILVLSRTNHLLEPIQEACRRNRVPVANPDRNIPGVRILSAHRAKGLEAPVVIIVNASDHLLGFPSKVENPDVLEPVRMSAGNDKAEERRLFYVAITRTMKRLHLISRKGLPSPYLAEIEGQVGSPAAADPSRVRIGARFDGYFSVERLNPLTDRQKSAGIRQSGKLTTAAGRFWFTSWAPTNLEEGQTYWINGAQKDRPYRNLQQIKLDSRTSIERRAPRVLPSQGDAVRELRPLPLPNVSVRDGARAERG